MDKPPIHHAIIAELCEALTAIRPRIVPPKLLGIIASWGDNLGDQEVLDMLKTWNETGDIELH